MSWSRLQYLARALPRGIKQHCLYASIGEQKLYHWFSGRLLHTYTVSTSRNPPSCVENSLGTPLGWHEVADKIGAGAPAGMVFKGRVATGKTADQYPLEEQQNNLITTRILRLRGLQPGYNQGPGLDTYDRYVYIHGTNQENRLGQPNSHGCILLSNHDVEHIFETVAEGTPLWID